MKNLKLVFVFALSSFLMVSCGNEDEMAVNFDEQTIQAVDSESDAVAESTFEDIDNIAEAGLASATANGRVEEDELISCAVVIHDAENKVITIDYGDGCEDRRGRYRKGLIRIEYSDDRYVPGAFRIITFDDFSIDSVGIEGVRTITNIAETDDDTLQFNVKMEAGKLTFPDGTFYTQEADFTRTWIRANNPLEDEGIREGGAFGVNRNNEDYVVTIIERIVFKRDCNRLRFFIPVSGVKEIKVGSNTAIVDYGDGTCDNLYTVSINGGEAIEYEFGQGRIR